MSKHPSETFADYGWACTCEACASQRQAVPPTPEQLVQFADLIAERNRVGQRPEKQRRRGRLKTRPDEPAW